MLILEQFQYILGTQSREFVLNSCPVVCSGVQLNPSAGLLNWAAVGVGHDDNPPLVRYGV